MRLLPLGRQTVGNPDWELRIGTDNDTDGGSHGRVDVMEVGDSGKRLTGTAPSAPASQGLSRLGQSELCSASRHARRLGYTFGRSTFAK
jgi:hypothetical protein